MRLALIRLDDAAAAYAPAGVSEKRLAFLPTTKGRIAFWQSMATFMERQTPLGLDGKVEDDGAPNNW
jgi:hypothetical protein